MAIPGLQQIITQVTLTTQQAISGWNLFAQAGRAAFQVISTSARQSAAATNASLTQIQNGLMGIGTAAVNTGRTMRQAGISMTIGLSAPVGAMVKTMSSAASEANEMTSRFNILFAKQGDDVKKWSEELGQSIGRSSIKLQGMASTFQAFFVKIDPTGKKAADLSKQFVVMAQDLSSFWDVTEDEALTALRAGLVGEIEPLRKFGILLSEQAVKVQALKMGFHQLNGTFTETEKVQARVALITKQMGAAEGDAKRTSQQFANQVRALQGAWYDLRVEIGQNINEIILPLVIKLKDLLIWFKNLPEGVQTVIAYFALFIMAVGPVLTVVGQLVMGLGWFAQGISFIIPAFRLLTSLLVPFSIALRGIGLAFQFVIGFIGGFGSALTGAIAAVGLWPILIAVALGVALALIIYYWDDIIKAIMSAQKSIETNLKDSWNLIGNIFTTAIQYFQGKWDQFVSYLESKWGAFGTFVITVIENMFSPLTNLINLAKEAFAWINKANAAEASGGGGGIGHMATGGPVPRNMFARIHAGEFVHRAAAVRKYGLHFMQMVNSLALPAAFAGSFADGGLVMGPRSLSMATSGEGGGLGSRPFNLIIDGRTFNNLRAPADTAESLIKYARQRQVQSAGKKPDWYGG